MQPEIALIGRDAWLQRVGEDGENKALGRQVQAEGRKSGIERPKIRKMQLNWL
jgi:hypothetical protein